MISNITKNCLLQSNSVIPVLITISGDDMVQYILLSMCLSPHCHWLVTVGIWEALSVNPEYTQTPSAVIPKHIMWFLTLAFYSESKILPLAIPVQLLCQCSRWDKQHCEHACLLSGIILVSAGDWYECTLQAVPAGKKVAPVLCPSVNQHVKREPHSDPSARIPLFPSATMLYAFHRTLPQSYESSSLGSRYPTVTDGHNVYSIITIRDIAALFYNNELKGKEPTSWHY